MDAVQTLKDLGDAVADAQAKADTLAGYKRELAAIVAEKQATIDMAQQAYDDAKVATDRLQEQLRQVLGNLLPDPRVRLSK
jgi:hypothetical protein